MRNSTLFLPVVLTATLLSSSFFVRAADVPLWQRFEVAFRSDADYENPLYDVREFYALFTAPSGSVVKINGFWDGERDWKVRFMPDEEGRWSYHTTCSETSNRGLHGISGSFECIPAEGRQDIYTRGRITHQEGNYYLNHEDGTPFFWLACTAWNGGLKSTPQEWEHYLEQRAGLGYNVIQLVATQWRGCDVNSRGEVAFTGCGRITMNPSFFQHFDQKMDRLNTYGHVAGLVLLWALPFGEGRELSPGYYLPDQEAVLLARYIIARYQAHHVVWVLGGDGKYDAELEDRWRYIGRQVFRDDPPGLATLHPHGRLWVGSIYGKEAWYDIDGYQSSHSTGKSTVRFINRTIGEGWRTIPPRPVINLEPCYEQIRNEIFEDDVRNASYWSVFAAPPSGVTYGGDGVWPWLREGEWPLNHRRTEEVSPWFEGIELPGSRQIGYLGTFMRNLRWWELLPAGELLLEQPGEEDYRRHISVLRSEDYNQVLVYFPVKEKGKLLLPTGSGYRFTWFDPVTGEQHRAMLQTDNRVLSIESPFEKDAVLVLTADE